MSDELEQAMLNDGLLRSASEPKHEPAASIPGDVMQRATKLRREFYTCEMPDEIELLARALLSAEQAGAERERERCAKIAESLKIETVIPAHDVNDVTEDGEPYTYTVPETRQRRILGGSAIAAAIRQDSEGK